MSPRFKNKTWKIFKRKTLSLAVCKIFLSSNIYIYLVWHRWKNPNFKYIKIRRILMFKFGLSILAVNFSFQNMAYTLWPSKFDLKIGLENRRRNFTFSNQNIKF